MRPDFNKMELIPAIVQDYQTKEERLPRVNAIHDEYSKRFDDEIGEVKIPYEGNFYTLEEAEALLRSVEEEEPTIDSVTFVKARKGIIEYQRYLDSTDWYVIRQTETGEPIPQEVLQARSEARSKIDNFRALGV